MLKTKKVKYWYNFYSYNIFKIIFNIIILFQFQNQIKNKNQLIFLLTIYNFKEEKKIF